MQACDHSSQITNIKKENKFAFCKAKKANMQPLVSGLKMLQTPTAKTAAVRQKRRLAGHHRRLSTLTCGQDTQKITNGTRTQAE